MNKKPIKIITAAVIILVVLVASCWYIFLQPISPTKTHFKSGDAGYCAEYWADAYNWLNKQDTTNVDTSDGSKFLLWWDYDFYLSDVDGHTTVLDDSKNSIQVIANFHTAADEKEAVAVWTIGLLEQNCKDNNGVLSEDVILVLEKYVSTSDADKIKNWIETPTKSPSYNTPVGSEYDEELSKQYLVGGTNAVYHDVTELLNNMLDEEKVTWLYHDIQQATGHSFRYYGVDGVDRQIFTILSFLADKSLLFVALNEPYKYNLEDDFMQIKFVNTSDIELTHDELSELLGEIYNGESEQSPIANTKLYYKDAYFDTIFYKTYIGPYQIDQTTGSKQEYDWQVPCYTMKHFYAEYMSDLAVYPYYDTGKSAVVIAKYYEGAYVNGTVTFMGNPIDAEINVLKNITYSSYRNVTFPIEHDGMSLATDGKFNLIAGADAWLQIRRNFGQYIAPFAIKNVTFDGTLGSGTVPISDDDAMRKGTNYERTLNITILPALFQGYIYLDNNDNGSFNQSVDTTVKNVNISLYELLSETQTTLADVVASDVNGHFIASDLLPSYYFVRSEKNGFVINETLVPLYENENYLNFSEMKHSSIAGKVYYNDEDNSIGGADVELTYNRMDISGQTVEAEILAGTTTTDSNGEYAFSDLVPGVYLINATKFNTTTGHLDYYAEEYITLEENEIKSFNISVKSAR